MGKLILGLGEVLRQHQPGQAHQEGGCTGVPARRALLVYADVRGATGCASLWCLRAPMAPCNSIVAGCIHANNAARMMPYDILELAHRTAPKAWPRQYVDDVQIRAEGACSIAGHQIATSAASIIRSCEADRLPISGKSALVASHPAVRDAVGATAAAMGLALTQADTMMDLGCDTTIGSRRRRATQAKRTSMARQRKNRAKLFLRAARWRRRSASLCRTNIRAKQQCDQAVTGMTSHDI
eukprot:2918646-Pyramimonas_sp.AAC.1